jgi:hypothetical protein
MFNIVKFLMPTPRRNHEQGGEGGTPLRSGLSPLRLSPNPKRRNTNLSPGSRVISNGVLQSSTTASADINQHWKSVDEVTNLDHADDIGHDLFEPPRLLHSTITEGIFSQSNSAPPMLKEGHQINERKNIMGNMRNVEAVMKHRVSVMQGLDFPDGMPLGPFGIIDRLSIKQDGDDNGKRKKGIEMKDVPAMEHIANPPVQQKQSQVRKQPSAIGAPTTSSYKAAGARSSRERKQTMKAKESKALGRS